MQFKQSMKLLIGKTISPLDKAIIVNSYGRSGSTVLNQSIINSITNNKSVFLNKLADRSIKQQAWKLDENTITSGFVYKTHDYPPQNNFQSAVRIIYIFADPVDVVLSLLRIFDTLESDEWMRLHFEHLKAYYINDFYSIIDKDTLGLEIHLDAWLSEKRFTIAFVRYEKLWTNQYNLANFLNIPLQLLPYKERNARQTHSDEIVERLNQTYYDLRNKVNSLDDFFVLNQK